MALTSRTIARLSAPFEGGSGPTHNVVDRIWLTADAQDYLPESGNKAEKVRGGLLALRDGVRHSARGPLQADPAKLARVAEELALTLVSGNYVSEDHVAEALELDGLSVPSPNTKSTDASSRTSTSDSLTPKQPDRKVSMFIGSSVEGLPIARELQAELEFDVESTIWSQGVFGLGDGTLETLAAKAPTYDFAALVLTPDDLLSRRDATASAPRDNVVFEAGLFMGALGRRRVFMVSCRDDQLSLPSDFAGITMAQYSRRSDDNLRAAIGPVATNIRTAIRAAREAPEAPRGRATSAEQESGPDATGVLQGEASDDARRTLPHVEEEPEQDPQDDLYDLLNAIDQLTPLLQAQAGPLRGDLGKLYGAILIRVKAARPSNPFVSTLSMPKETVLSGIYQTTAAEAVAGLSMMRSALLSAT